MNLLQASVVLSVAAVLSIGGAQDQPTTGRDFARFGRNAMRVEAQFENMVPPNTSIEAKEISRTGTSGKDLEVRFEIRVTGFPPGALFQQIEWPVTSDRPIQRIQGISVGEDGILMCAGKTSEQCGTPERPDDPIEFVANPVKGEPTRLIFEAGGIRIGTVIVWDPINTKDKGCTLSVIRLTPGFELAYLSGSGYPPDTEVHYRFGSELENDAVTESNPTGSIRFAVGPHQVDRLDGITKVKVEAPHCEPELSYKLGNG